MWENKSDDGGYHDKDNTYVWTPGSGSIWEWIGLVNSEGVSGFAGHSDWRIANVKELQSIIDYGRVVPSVHPGFNTACSAGCTVVTCSCTAASYYWSSTTYASSPTSAWGVNFSNGLVDFNLGYVSPNDKTGTRAVRAVRGGL